MKRKKGNVYRKRFLLEAISDMKMSRCKYWLLLLCALFAGAQWLSAQEFTGRVSDQTGAAVTKATVTAHNLLTNEDIATQTNGSGVYTIPYLKPGVFSVTASAPGFSNLVKNNITLEVGKTGVVNFDLKVGAASASVTVEADVDLDLGKADRGEVVENARVTELPLNGRDPQMLALLNAGVVWGNSQSYSQYQRPFDSTATSLMINGGGSGNNELLLDGVSNDVGNGNSVTGYIAPVDAVQEFKIITNPYDAQYGRAQGGVMDITLKSGTNKLHGDVYEFARRSWLDADTWQNDYLNAKQKGSATKGQHKLDQYGFELDGPVNIPKIYNGKDKTFFVVQFENWDEKVPNTLVTSVPDPAWITGDFSNLTWWTGSKYSPITIYDPSTIHDNGSGTLVRDTFTNNKIPTSRMNAVALKLLSLYPAPNLTPASGTNPYANNYTVPNPTTDKYRNVLGKLDQNLGANDRFALRYGYWERWETRSDNGMPGEAKRGAEPFGQHSHTFNIDWVHTFSSSLVFDFRGGVIARGNFWNNGPQGYDLSKNLGWSGSYFGSHMPQMSISEFATLGNGGANDDIENSLNLAPSITWIKGGHTIHAGVDYRDLQKSIKSTEGGLGFYVDRLWTQQNYLQWDQASGNSVASMLLGLQDSGSNAINAQAYWVQHYIAPYIQDDWKVTKKLTLNLGLRWDWNGPPLERHNRVDYAFDTTMTNPVDSLVDHSLLPNAETLKGGVTFVGVNGKPGSYYAGRKTNFQPRVGFAYALNSKTVVRGGFGKMFSNPTPGGNQYGWSSSTSFDASEDGNKTPKNTLTNPFPALVLPTGSSTGALTNLGGGPWFINPNYKTPGIWQFSLGAEREVGKGNIVELSYVGSRGVNQDSSDNINRWSSSYQAKCNIEMGGSHHVCDDSSTGYVTNPFQGVSGFSGTSYYTASTIQAGNLTRPYPEFGNVIEWQLNDGRTWYNSLQLTGMHRWKNDLTLHATWTWSKMMGKGGYADQVYRIKSRWIDGSDMTHRITLSGVYDLPVGRGRLVFGHTNRIVDAAIGGWELGALYVYQTGTPWTTGLEYPHSGRVHRSVDKATGYIRGVSGCVDNTDLETGAHTPYSNNYTGTCSQPDFIVRPSYAATQNITYTGIRIPNLQQFDSNLSKNFALYRDYKLQLRLEAFNALNHPLWQEGYNGTASDPNFGTIERGAWGQSNLPRQVQVALKVIW
jgi:hypothetical protein